MDALGIFHPNLCLIAGSSGQKRPSKRLLTQIAARFDPAIHQKPAIHQSDPAPKEMITFFAFAVRLAGHGINLTQFVCKK
jgi:hypothetical protein